MKQQINIVLFILIFCLLSACSNDDFGIYDRGMAGDEPLPVLISGNKSVSTRVNNNGDMFSDGDRVGLYMKKSRELLRPQSILEGVDNIEFKCTGASKLSWIKNFEQVGETVYYPVDNNQPVDFIAYYPYNPSLPDYGLPINVATQFSETNKELDILYSNNVTNRTKNKDTVPLTFNHMMARMQLELFKENGQSYVDATLVQITGLKRTARLNLVNGKMEAFDSEGPIDITSSTSVYSAFLIPQSATHSKLYITTKDDGIFVYEFPAYMAFESGEYYQYRITIKNKTELEVNQVSITGWEGKDEEPIEDRVNR